MTSTHTHTHTQANHGRLSFGARRSSLVVVVVVVVEKVFAGSDERVQSTTTWTSSQNRNPNSVRQFASSSCAVWTLHHRGTCTIQVVEVAAIFVKRSERHYTM